VNRAGNEVDAGMPEFTHEALPALLLEYNFFMHGSMAFRRSVALEVGGYDDSYVVAQDYDLWLRLAWHQYRFGFVEERLCTWRMHSSSMSSTGNKVQTEETLRIQVHGVRWIREHPEMAAWVDRAALRRALAGLSWQWRHFKPAWSAEAARLMMSLWPTEPEGYKLYALSLPCFRVLARVAGLATGGPQGLLGDRRNGA
jgi:hypothetical protein